MLRRLLALVVLLAATDSMAEMRQWSDTSGKYTTKAEFVGIADGEVQLLKESGESIRIRLDALCRKDQEFAFSQVKQAAPQEVVKFAEPAVVCIETSDGLGSGFIASEDGIIVTNHHVVEGITQAKIVLKDKTELPVKGFITCDPGRDIALVKVDSPAPLPTLPVATILPEKLDPVIAIGAPRGLSFTATEGTISSTRTTADVLEAIRRLAPSAHSILEGYAPDSLWIQTTAAISSGNSGGPLINLRGQVVGINTWSRVDGQNLNFALACTEISKIYQAAPKQQCHSLLAIPRGRTVVPTGPTRSPSAIPTLSITLPSGTRINNDTFRLDLSRIERATDDTSIVMQARNGYKIIACHLRGVPSGPTVATYPNNTPCVYAEYDDGRRDGVLATWNEAGQRVLFANYLKGRRHGLSCMFHAGSLRLVLECEGDRVESVHLVIGGKLNKSFSSQPDAAQDLDGKACLDEYDKVTEDIDKNERDFRKAIRDEDERLRKERVAMLNPAKRQAIQNRVNKRSADRAVLIREMHRRAGDSRAGR